MFRIKFRKTVRRERRPIGLEIYFLDQIHREDPLDATDLELLHSHLDPFDCINTLIDWLIVQSFASG
jgi:hypothetical protein